MKSTQLTRSHHESLQNGTSLLRSVRESLKPMEKVADEKHIHLDRCWNKMESTISCSEMLKEVNNSKRRFTPSAASFSIHHNNKNDSGNRQHFCICPQEDHFTTYYWIYVGYGLTRAPNSLGRGIFCEGVAMGLVALDVLQDSNTKAEMEVLNKRGILVLNNTIIRIQQL